MERGGIYINMSLKKSTDTQLIRSDLSRWHFLVLIAISKAGEEHKLWRMGLFNLNLHFKSVRTEELFKSGADLGAWHSLNPMLKETVHQASRVLREKSL